jgi:hypothetical protein
MRQITEEEKKMIWKEVLEEFPDDITMQEVHYVHLLHYYQTKGMTSKERINFYSNIQKES